MMNNDHDGDEQGAGALRHMGPATKKLKKKKPMPPPQQSMPMSQGMSGMDDDEGGY